jgi:hypothetical protein
LLVPPNGREVIVQARDDTLSWHDSGLVHSGRTVPETAAPEVHQIAADYAALASLSPELRAMVRRLVVRSTDSALFYVLKYLNDLEPQLIVDDQEISMSKPLSRQKREVLFLRGISKHLFGIIRLKAAGVGLPPERAI